jgi:hypothetical protein
MFLTAGEDTHMPGQQRYSFMPWLITALAVMSLSFEVRAQITRILPVKIGAAIQTGSVRVTYSPPAGGDTLKPFDGSPFTEFAALASDSIVVTLQFDSLAHIEKSKVFFWNAGVWKLEIADSLVHLNTRSGSYTILTEGKPFSPFMWDSVTFAPRTARFVRLSGVSTQGVGVYIGEWMLEGTVTFTSFVILPPDLRVIPGGVLQLSVNIKDDQGVIHPNFLTEPLDWGTADPSIARVDPAGKLTGLALGATTVIVRTDARTLSGTAPVSVVQHFRPEKVAPMIVKVAVVYQDPVLSSGNRIHEEFHWRDPRVLAPSLIKHFRECTDSVVHFQLVETVEASRLFTRYKGTFMSVEQYVQLLKEPGWPTLKAASDSGQLAFDYREFVKFYHYDDKRNAGQIDEVWVFAGPYLAMWESQLLGPNAFWWNSTPIRDGTALTKLLSVMGLNYERGVDQAFHSFGHRTESAIREAYREAQGKPWNPQSSNPTPWDRFTRINKDMPGQAHVGNVHFPPNGVRDYDYGNTTPVTSYAENWYRYPYLFEQVSQVNVSTWYYTPGEPLAEGLDHLGYLRWWYGHLPRYVGVSDGVLNNWWHYALDYEAAVALAKTLSAADAGPSNTLMPEGFHLQQNYPNPFNPSTIIEFTLGSRSSVTLQVFNVLGQRVADVLDGTEDAGPHRLQFDGHTLASGIYFYRLSTPQGVATKKMTLVK